MPTAIDFVFMPKDAVRIIPADIDGVVETSAFDADDCKRYYVKCYDKQSCQRGEWYRARELEQAQVVT